MKIKLTGIPTHNMSIWIERNTTCILVALVPFLMALALLLNAFTKPPLFPLANPVVTLCALVAGVVLLLRVKFYSRSYKKKERVLHAAAVLTVGYTCFEIAQNDVNGSWIWLCWAYVTAVTAITPSLLKSAFLLLATLSATALAIYLGQTPASLIQNVGKYLFFGVQSIGLCLLILSFLRQQRSAVRRRYRQKMRKFHELNFFFENLASPIFVKDDNNNLVRVNRAAAALFNTTPYSLTGKNLSEIVPKEMAEQMLKEDKEILDGKEMPPAIHKLSLPALEHPQWFRITKRAYAFKDPARRGVMVTIENIHEQLNYEAQLKQSEKRFKTIFEKAPVAMMMVKDCFSNFIEVNEALCQLLGYHRQELLALSPSSVTHPHDELKAFPIIEEAWKSGKDFITLEKRFLHKSGRVLHTITALQLVEEPGKDRYLIGMVLDISARKEFEENLKRKSFQLKQSNESLREFAYAASHDLKQPLRTINSFTQLMLRYLPKEGTKPEVFEFAGHIKSGVKRMETLINGLLEFSRIGNARMNLQTMEVLDVIIDVCKNLGQQIQENGAEIDVVYPVPTLTIDPLKFTSLLQNLISNAIKYRRPEVTPLIRLQAEEQEHHWLFSVADNGKGIPENQIENVFGLYKRLDADKDIEGTGIGLSLCRRIVSRHGGKIWVKSEPGKGSTFYFTISKHVKETTSKEQPADVLQ